MEKVLSIVTITYNQEKYIAQCIECILNQKTNFKFELIISDDCSTDETKNIIEKYAKQYPDIIKPIYRSTNIGATKNFIDTLALAESKYLAICEGDDYWIDENKLQKQVDFLENHPECSICFHPVKVVFDGYDIKDYTYPTEEQIKNGFTFENLLKYNFIQTNSVMYRWGFKDKDISEVYPDGILPGDWYLHLLHAKLGKIGFIDEVMAVYRRNPNGIWSDAINDIGKLHQKYGLKEMKFYDSVYKFITDNSENYYKNALIPGFKGIYIWFVKYNENEKIEQAFKTYPEHFAKICLDYYIEKESLSQQLAQANAVLKQTLPEKINFFKKKLSLIMKIYGK